MLHLASVRDVSDGRVGEETGGCGLRWAERQNLLRRSLKQAKSRGDSMPKGDMIT